MSKKVHTRDSIGRRGTKASKPYAVGYGKPPLEHRFKKGEPSKNPNGRKKKTPTLPEIMGKELKKRRHVVIDGQRVRMPTQEILAQQIVTLALKGNSKALSLAMALWEQHLNEEKEQANPVRIWTGRTVQQAADAYAQTLKAFRENKRWVLEEKPSSPDDKTK